MNSEKIKTVVVILCSQLLITSLSIFSYHKFISLRPHILKTGHNSFTSKISRPDLDKKTDYIDHLASIIGEVHIGRNVFIAPQAPIRGDEGTPLYIGNDSNIQDGVVIHALETEENGKPILEHLKTENGHKYAVYIGNRVSLAHQSQVHGPAIIEDDTFIGMQSLIFNSTIKRGSVIEPGCKVMGVTISEKKYAPIGSIIDTQAKADKLPMIDQSYQFKDINKSVVNVNTQLARTYNSLYGN